MSVDPLAGKYPSLSSYNYCGNNPVNMVDPNGMNFDWVSRVVDGITEVYYDRDIKSQADIDTKYGKNSGVTHLKDGSTVAGYTFYNDHKDNKYGTVYDSNGALMDNSKIIYGDKYTIFGTSDNSVNAETLHKNLMGTSYTGANNPLDYLKNDSYQYKPRNISEYGSVAHDIMYDDKKAKGVNGALFNTDVINADIGLAKYNIGVAMDRTVPLKDRGRAAVTAYTFSYISLFKSIQKLF